MIMLPSQKGPLGPPIIVVDVAPEDVDGYGIVHFARYPLFAEEAGLAFLERQGFGLDSLDRLGLELRVRELRITYRASARLEVVTKPLVPCGKNA